jgi:hypothetical protein
MNLPPDSAISRAGKNAPGGWDNTTEMVAELIDTTHGVLRVLQVAHLKDPPTGDLPRVPRPYETTVAPKTLTLSELSGFLGSE